MKYRRLRLLKRFGDLEWLSGKSCPKCRTPGRLLMGHPVRNKLRCQECGHQFTIKGRPVRPPKEAA